MTTRTTFPITPPKQHLSWSSLCFVSSQESGEVAKIPSALDADSLLAKELSQLSTEEREKVYDDIHGVSAPVEEEEEATARLLSELEIELNCIHEKTAYEMALALNRNYVCNRNFRVMFLRADAYDAKAAAKRMVAFFEQKLEYFGADKLVTDITLQDLTEEDLDSLESGLIQKLKDKDRAGRTVLIVFPGLKKDRKLKNMVRVFACGLRHLLSLVRIPVLCFISIFNYISVCGTKLRATFYVAMSCLEDDQAQRRGFVASCYATQSTAPDHKFDPTYTRSFIQLRNVIPCRVESKHFCFDNAKLYWAFSLAICLSGSYSRVRLRAHYGR